LFALGHINKSIAGYRDAGRCLYPFYQRYPERYKGLFGQNLADLGKAYKAQGKSEEETRKLLECYLGKL
jgi:hypothetical protein